MEAVTRAMTLRRLKELPVAIHTSTRVNRLVEGEAFVSAEGSDAELSIGVFDSVLVAVGHRSFDPLSAALERSGVRLTVIGDALRPGQILDATGGGHAAALEFGRSGSGLEGHRR
jgi:hypothetical protein